MISRFSRKLPLFPPANISLRKISKIEFPGKKQILGVPPSNFRPDFLDFQRFQFFGNLEIIGNLFFRVKKIWGKIMRIFQT
jgi:hypothetical protein